MKVLGRCQAPGCLRRAVHQHHVVYEQEVDRRGADPRDLRNYMPLCVGCHFQHHGRAQPLPLTALSDDHHDFAFELLGAFAYDYLRRRYAGDDPRLDARLALAEAA